MLVEVRLEYAWAPLDRWLEGRTGFLSSYLAHERLYLQYVQRDLLATLQTPARSTGCLVQFYGPGRGCVFDGGVFAPV